ncbi:hypothetical protein PIROE2DRAFT_67093 [Piromyces sp. E2]|nr:hypothetical protein PIROE2DRAFT_67093 [Piromyces sp. E2]|eukprot:OUM66646.1 hypothetical protein PIROE2DRAFT_67093 [Piromyces sp. E2]
MTTNNLEKESRSAPVSIPGTAPASVPLSTTDSAPNLNDLEDTETTIKNLQKQLDGLAVQTKQVFL